MVQRATQCMKVNRQGCRSQHVRVLCCMITSYTTAYSTPIVHRIRRGRFGTRGDRDTATTVSIVHSSGMCAVRRPAEARNATHGNR